MGIKAKLFRYILQQFFFNIQNGLARSQAGAIRDAEDMGVYGDGGMTESGVENHIGGFAADTGQGFQRCPVFRHLAVILFHQDATGLDNVFCLAVEKANGSNVFPEAVLSKCMDGFGGTGLAKQFCRGLVDALVGGLRGENHGNQQFKGRVVVQFGCRMRIGLLQTGEQFHTLSCLHDGDCGLSA